MNSPNFAALAITASLLSFTAQAFTAQAAQAAEGPLAHFAGNWSGNGKITVQNGTSERIRCRSTNTASGNGLALSMRCASDSYTFNLGSDITADGGNVSGSWNESSRGVMGSLTGKISGSNITATATTVGVTAALSIRSAGNTLSVSIRSPGSEVSEVAVSMARGK